MKIIYRDGYEVTCSQINFEFVEDGIFVVVDEVRYIPMEYIKEIVGCR